jgi:hypothetical protein
MQNDEQTHAKNKMPILVGRLVKWKAENNIEVFK